jgi:prevent-host-death family protein
MDKLTVEELQNDLGLALKRARRKAQVCVAEGSSSAVLMPLASYKKLLQRIEELEDALDLKKAIARPGQTRRFADYLRERGEDV